MKSSRCAISFLGLLAITVPIGCSSVSTVPAPGGSATLEPTSSRGRPGVAQFLPALPRQPVTQVAWETQTTAKVPPRESFEEEFSDEYVIDGGDRGQPVHYGNDVRYGLETEDTVVEYSDDTGQQHVLPTNRVAIYSPRFGAVRSVSLPIEGFSVERLAATHRLTRDMRHSNQIVTRDHRQQIGTVGLRVRSRASGVQADELTAGVSEALRIDSHVKLLNLFEEINSSWAGRVEQADQPRLAKMMENAAAWSLDVAPRGTISTSVGQVLDGLARDQTYTVYDPHQKAIGKLRIRKLADRGTAEAGDVVTITIVFENVGERPLRKVRIVDNLSPRLAFVPESGTIGFIDQDKQPLEGDKWGGQIRLQDNEEGSDVLVFEIDG